MLKPALTVSLFQKEPKHLDFAAGEVIFEIGEPGSTIIPLHPFPETYS
jgi:hypothetical protein